MIKAGRLLFEKLIPLTGSHDSADQQIKKEENTDRGIKQIDRIPEEEHLVQVIELVYRIVKEENAGSSRYASAESDLDSDESFGIQRMSLGPTRQRC